MGNEGVGMGTDVTFKVKRAGEVIDERRVVGDIEVDAAVVRFAEELMKLIDKEEE